MSAPTSAGVNGPSPPSRWRLALGDLGEQLVPLALDGSNGRGDIRVRPTGGGHLLQDPDVTGLDVLIEEVAGAFPLPPERLWPAEHRALSLDEPDVLGLEDREDELLLAAEVIVDLAERNAGRVRDATRREVRVAVGQQAGTGRLEDARPRLAGRLVPSLSSCRGASRARLLHMSSIRPTTHEATA